MKRASIGDEVRGVVVPIADPLRRIGRELQALATLVEEVEAAVGRLLERSPPGPGDPVRELQSLDLLRQQVLAIAAFSRTLSRHTPESWVLDLEAPLRAVALSDLTARLHPGTGPPPVAPAGGQCEFF
jgi:hypothetical protein